MQILGLADSTPKPENRFKTLFWPAIRHETDVDNITRQGFWVCLFIAALSLGFAPFLGGATIVIECYESLFFFLSGVGVRMRSVFAAVSAFVVYAAGTLVLGIGIP